MKMISKQEKHWPDFCYYNAIHLFSFGHASNGPSMSAEFLHLSTCSCDSVLSTICQAERIRSGATVAQMSCG